MLKVYSFGNLAFRGTSSAALAAERIETSRPEYEPAVKKPAASSDPLRESLKEGVFRYNRLEKSRPVLLANTAVDTSDWLMQFETAEERNLVIKMLQNFVYVDINHARDAFRQLHNDLKEEIDMDKTKFSTLGIAKSGDVMSYFYRQAAQIRSKGPVHHKYTDTTGIKKEDPFIDSTQLENPEYNKKLQEDGIENMVIIDDMIGDGDSLIEYFTPELVESLKGYKNVYYVTLIKDPDGEKKVKETFPELNIQFRCAQEVHKYDSPLNSDFTDEEKENIDKLLLKYGKLIDPKLIDKYSRSKLLLSFDWNTPGNTPMIFNYSTDEWNGLFNRYNGLERVQQPTDRAQSINFFC